MAILPDRVPDKPWLGTPLERENDEVSGGARPPRAGHYYQFSSYGSSRDSRHAGRDEEGEGRELTGR